MRELNRQFQIQEISETIPDRFKKVFEESCRLGTYVVTKAKNSENTLRFYLEPERESIKGLTVFISYATPEEEWASTVAEQLQYIGFTVDYIPSSSPVQGVLSKQKIEERLLESLNRADYLCMLFSTVSKDRPWVLFEVEEAARQIGRVILLRNDSVSSIIELNIPGFQSDDFSISCVKHTVVYYDAEDPARFIKLARQIINDPDEGVTDGTNRPFVIRERNLKRESVMRRYVRQQVGLIRKYSTRNVIDVIPFFLADLQKDIEVNRGEFLNILNWFARNHGRLNQLLHSQSHLADKWEYEWETFPTPERAHRWTDAESIEAIVIIDPNLTKERKQWSSGDESISNSQFGISKGGK